MTSPSCDINELKSRYDSVEYFLNNRELLQEVKTHLKIKDLSRLYRQFAVGKVNVYKDIPRIVQMNDKIITLLELFDKQELKPTWLPDNTVIDNFKQYCDKIHEVFDVENIGENHNVFKEGISEELDTIWQSLANIDEEILALTKYLGDLIDVEIKKEYNEKNGFFLSTTKKRATDLKKKLVNNNPDNIEISTNTNSAKLTSPRLNTLSEKWVLLNSKKTQIEYRLVNLYAKEWYKIYYKNTIEFVIDALSWMDVYYSFATSAIEWNYCRPELIDTEDSSVEAKSLRHPIIEQLLRNERKPFVPNDINISSSNSYLLYGVNSVGKSSLMKSVGLSVIMAQSGMFVAAETFKLRPYEKIITRIGNTDNLFDAHSSFICEINEANKCVNKTDNRSLVIADEFCSSTERDSATSIVTTMIQWLVEKKSSFIFATHLFELLDTTREISGVDVVHLKVGIDDNGLIFERKLSPGPPKERNYGSMIAKSVFNDKKFIKMLDRNSVKKRKTRDSKRSRYNSSVIVECCQICGYTPNDDTMSLPLDVHHINMQCNANQDGFIDNFHKNVKSNLVVLCKECHIDTHKGKIDIKGYMQRDDGVKLDYTKLYRTPDSSRKGERIENSSYNI
tara:strand:- start:18849 stop:20708 length:1860 start_codon:yes stop_codon:yes gene_type:complete